MASIVGNDFNTSKIFELLPACTENHFSVGHTGSPEDVILNRVRSTSFVAALSVDEREKIDSEIKAVIAIEPLLAGKDVVTVPYETAAFYVEKLAR